MRNGQWTGRVRVAAAGLAAVGTVFAAGRAVAIGEDMPTTWHRLAREARAAYDAKDYPRCAAGFRAMLQAVPEQPDLIYSLACAEALSGHKDAALGLLEQFVGMGLMRDFAADSDLASLLKEPRFVALEQRMQRLGETPIRKSTAVATLRDADMIAEDVAYDPGSRSFFVSSVRRGKIVCIGSDGVESDFLPPGAERVWSVFALQVDTKRGCLWATTAGTKECDRYAKGDELHAALLRLDLTTGKIRQRFDLPEDGKPHVLGDMTCDDAGDVFVTDSIGGGLYELSAGGSALETIAPPGTFLSSQTPAMAGQAEVWVPDYVLGIARVDLRTKAVTWIPRSPTGVDGMYRSGDVLFAVQNGYTPCRILRYGVRGTRLSKPTVVERSSEGYLGQPTHGVHDGKWFYFLADTGWDRVKGDGSMGPAVAGRGPSIRRMAR